MLRWFNIKISRRILLGFGFAALLTLVVAAVSINNLNIVGQRLTSIAEQDQLMLTSALELQVAVEQESDGIRGYLLSGDQSFLEPFTTGQSLYSETVTKLDGLVVAEEDRRFLADINTLHDEFIWIAEWEISVRDQDLPQTAIFLWQQQGNEIKSDLRTKLISFVERQEGIISQHHRDAGTQQNQALAIAIILVVLAWAAGTVGAIWISRSITRPVKSLVSATEAISRGDLTTRISIPGTDELASLGSSMNQMVSDLAQSKETTDRLLVETQQRAEQLRAINEVGRRISSVLSLDELLPYVVSSLQKTFNYYNVNIFLLDPGSDRLVLKAGAGGYKGEIPIGFHIKLAEGMIGSVAQTGEALVANDVSKEPNYLFIEELTDTRSELAVPIRIGTTTLGVLDIESTEINAFDKTEMFTAQTLADQIAIAIENARLYQDTRDMAVLEERNRLARDLHDAVSQTLFSTSLIAEVVPSLWEKNQDEGRRRLEEVRQLTKGALAEMRMLLLELRPAALLDTELEVLLRQLAESITGRAIIPVEVKVKGQCTVSPDVKVALYRIAQEALNNVAKHAGAREVKVNLLCKPDKVTLKITDDGKGFDMSRVPSDSLGVGIMRERAGDIGASLSVQSWLSHGTEIMVVWDNLSREGKL